jgi:HK97 family phage prohead protease
MPIPRPNEGESQDDYISRCVSFLMDEGTVDDNDQAVAICMGIWAEDRGHHAGIERRFVAPELRLVERGEGEPPRIEGYAAVFNERSVLLWDFVETIEPGFFDGVLGDDVRALWNHDENLVLGRTRAETLSLSQDDRGLQVAIDPPATSWGRDATVSIARGDVDQMSFAFEVSPGGDDWRRDEDGTLIRTLKRGGCARLYDVSPVTFPAYPTTTVQVRSQARALVQEQDPRSMPGAGGGEGQEAPPPGDDAGSAQGRLAVMARHLDLMEKII